MRNSTVSETGNNSYCLLSRLNLNIVQSVSVEKIAYLEYAIKIFLKS